MDLALSWRMPVIRSWGSFDFEDLPIIYEITGSAGHTFWEKLGFRLVDRHPYPELQDRNKFPEFIMRLEEQANSIGLPPETARDRLVMRFDMT